MKKNLLALALAATAPFAAHASESNGIGYTYVQADYVYNDSSFDGEDADGGALSGSYAFTDNVFGFAGYSIVDANNYDAHATSWQLGTGFNAAIGNRADWVTRAAFVRADYKAKDCVDAFCVTERGHATGGL